MDRQKIGTVFDRSGAEAVLITDPFNIRYLSGFSGGEGMLYLSRNRKVLITDSRYTEAASGESTFEVIEENSGHKRESILAECLQSDGAVRIGYEDQFMRCSDFSKLENALPKVEKWIPLENLVNELRQVKTPEEQKFLRKAEAIGDSAFTEILKILRPGMTERDAACELEYQMKKQGAQGFSFDTIMASGKNSSMPHAVPSDKKFQTGDFITMDFGCLYEGYCSDMTRTVILGRADAKQKEIYQTVLHAQTEAIHRIKAGITGKEADSFARKIIEEAGFGKYFGHALGHSVGLFIHEKPVLSPNDHTVLKTGMIETVEPGIYVPGFGGVRIEDMVIITADGCEDLTHSDKQLIEL